MSWCVGVWLEKRTPPHDTSTCFYITAYSYLPQPIQLDLQVYIRKGSIELQHSNIISWLSCTCGVARRAHHCQCFSLWVTANQLTTPVSVCFQWWRTMCVQDSVKVYIGALGRIPSKGVWECLCMHPIDFAICDVCSTYARGWQRPFNRALKSTYVHNYLVVCSIIGAIHAGLPCISPKRCSLETTSAPLHQTTS